MLKPIYWTGPLDKACQLTGKPFRGVMYDAKLPGYGWGNYCEAAFLKYGGQLGMGLGQKYQLQSDGKWLKVAG
jgi:hypothetical protein